MRCPKCGCRMLRIGETECEWCGTVDPVEEEEFDEANRET